MSQLLSFNQPMPIGHSSRDIVIACFFSIIIHVFAALLLWIMATNRISVEPASPSIGTPLIVSLTTLPATSKDDLSSEEVRVVPHTDVPAQHPQSSPKQQSEAETILTVKDPVVQVTKTPEGNLPATNTTSTFSLDALNRMEFNFGNIPEFKTEAVDEILNQGVSVSGTPGGNSLAQYLTPSYGLEAVNRFEQVFGEFSEAELERKRIEWRINYIKKYEASLPPDCLTAYAKKGLLAIPYLIRDAITDNDQACKW